MLMRWADGCYYWLLFAQTQEGLQVRGVASMGISVSESTCLASIQSATAASKIAVNSCFNDVQCGCTQEILVSVVICLNFVVIIIEANYGAECDGNMTSHASMFNASHQKPHLTPQMTMKCMEMPGGCVPGWLSVINYCFVAFYTLEAFVAWRFGIFRPFRW